MAQQHTMMSPEMRRYYERDPRYGKGYFGEPVETRGDRMQEPNDPTSLVQNTVSQTASTTSAPLATSTNVQAQGNMPSAVGTLNYDPTSSANYSASTLPAVTDPDKAFANVSKRQHEFLVREFRPFEQALIESVNDTSLIDAVPQDTEEQARIAKEIDERNRSRYGYTRTAMEQQEVAREAERTQNLGLAGGLNNARLAQRERNQNLLAQLVNIGQGLNRGSLGQMGSAAEMAINRKNAYTQAKAQSKAQRWGFLGSL